MRSPTFYDASILIVDDEPANVLLIERMLSRAGYTNVTSVTDSRRVLSLYTSRQPDLILLDLHMPYLDGFAVMEQVVPQIPAGSYLPILVLTADMTAAVKERALAMGAKDFVTKPFDIVEVRLRIRNLLETHVLYRQLQHQNASLEEEVRARVSELDEARVEILRRLAQAEAATRLRDDFLRAAAHELRTPLTNIRGRADLMQGRLDRVNAPDHMWLRNHMGPLRQSINRLVATVEEITDATHIQTEQALPLRLESVDICTLVESVAADIGETSARRSAAPIVVERTVAAEGAAIVVRGDHVRLDRAVYSLIATVLKHNPPDVSIHVRIFPYGDGVAVTVAGDHVVPDGESTRIFTDFYQGLVAVGPRGTGLGLSAVAHVAAQHGGGLTVTGAAVSLYLPTEPDGPRPELPL